MSLLTCVATYTREALVTECMPWICAFPDHVALGSWSTELGKVKMCLYTFFCKAQCMNNKITYNHHSRKQEGHCGEGHSCYILFRPLLIHLWPSPWPPPALPLTWPSDFTSELAFPYRISLAPLSLISYLHMSPSPYSYFLCSFSVFSYLCSVLHPPWLWPCPFSYNPFLLPLATTP